MQPVPRVAGTEGMLVSQTSRPSYRSSLTRKVPTRGCGCFLPAFVSDIWEAPSIFKRTVSPVAVSTRHAARDWDAHVSKSAHRRCPTRSVKSKVNCTCRSRRLCNRAPALVHARHETKGISGFSDDVDEDYAWLSKNAFAATPDVFPADKFGAEDFRWAVGVALSRSFFVNGELRLTPLVDFANHASLPGVLEPTGGCTRWPGCWGCGASCCVVPAVSTCFAFVSHTHY